MRTIEKGELAESAILHALTAHGLSVFLPFGGAGPVDMPAVTAAGTIIRVQCKHGRVRDGCVAFKTCTTDHGRGQRRYDGRADVIAAYVPELDRVYVIPVHEAPKREAYLRLGTTANNQRVGIKWAEDYALEHWIASLAAGESLALSSPPLP